MKPRLLCELKNRLEYMSPVERKVAQMILADPQGFAELSLTEAAARGGVAQGSIVNFANKYCGGGFSTMKLAIAQAETDSLFSVVTDDDSVHSVLQKTNEGIVAALQNTAILNDEESLRTAAEWLLGAKKVEIYGIFRSAAVATDLCYCLLRLGIPATFVSDVLTCAVSASMLPADSVVVAVSMSGQTQDVIDAVKLAQNRGVKVIALTGHRNSPLANLADAVLVAASGGDAQSSCSGEIRISQMALIDTLCAYMQNKIDISDDRYFQMETILTSHNVRD